MGTNYYLRLPGMCDQQCDRWIHLGKSSAGWSFTFAARPDADPPVTDYASWLAQLTADDNAEVYDEYARGVTRTELLDLIESKRGGRNDTDEYSYLDADGNRFIKGYFS